MIQGEDVRISGLAIIKKPDLVKIGNHVAIDPGVVVSTMLTVHDHVHIAPYVCFIGGSASHVILQNFSFIAAGTKVVAGTIVKVGHLMRSFNVDVPILLNGWDTSICGGYVMSEDDKNVVTKILEKQGLC